MAGDELAEVRAEIGRIAHRLHNHLTVALGHTDLARRLLQRAPEGSPRDEVLADLEAVAKATRQIEELSHRLSELSVGDQEGEPG